MTTLERKLDLLQEKPGYLSEQIILLENQVTEQSQELNALTRDNVHLKDVVFLLTSEIRRLSSIAEKV